MRQRASVDLPHPDSPTSPIVSPLRTSKLTSSTACTRPISRWNTIPRLIGKYLIRWSTRSSVVPFAAGSAVFICAPPARRSSRALNQLGVNRELPALALEHRVEVAGVGMVGGDLGGQRRHLCAGLEP